MIQQVHLWVYLKEMKSLSWRDTCIHVFIAALFWLVKTWNQTKRPLMDE